MRAMRTIPRIRLALVGLLATALLACGPAAGTIAPTATAVAATPTATPRPVAAAPALSAPAPSATSTPKLRDQLFVFDGDQSGRFLVIDGATGQIERTLPAGVPDANWTLLYTAERIGEQTVISAVEVATGNHLRATQLEGHYSLPWVMPGNLPAGLSRDRQTLVLAREPGQDEIATFERENRWVTRFAVLDTAFERQVRIIEIEGNYSYDALAPGGSTLYIIEHQPPVHPTEAYAVRAYDLPAGALLPGAIVDKASAAQVMEGTPLEQIAPSGSAWVYTLYRSSRHGPFVHALEASNRFALCIDLPQAGMADEGAARYWGMVLTRYGNTLYTVNSALGQIAEIDASGASLRRTATFDPRVAAPPAGPIARLGRSLAPAASAKRDIMRGVALSPDGQTLVAVADHGLLVIDAASLKVLRRLAPDATFSSVAFGAEGSSFYAIDAGSGQIQRRDSATGVVLAELAAGVNSVGIVRVTAGP